jgi:glutamate 5-kinase
VSAHREAVRAARSVVVKIGTTALTNPAGLFDATRLAALADAIEARMKAGTDVVIVSSGAIAAGIEPLGLTRRPTDLATKQAAASVGQVALVNAWSTAFGRYARIGDRDGRGGNQATRRTAQQQPLLCPQ